MVYQLLKPVMELDGVVCMNLLFHSCAAFEDPSHFIAGLVLCKWGSAILKMNAMLQWMDLCSKGLSKLTPAMQLKGFGRMMHISAVTRDVKLGNRMEVAVIDYLERTQRRSIEDSYVLFGQILKSFNAHSDIDRLERYLDLVIAGVPDNFHGSEGILSNLILRAAQICHLLIVYNDKRGTDLIDYLPFGWKRSRIGQKYVIPVVGWINGLRKISKMPLDSFVKATLMTEGSYFKKFGNDKEQLYRCLSEILDWSLLEIERFPSSREWFTLLVLDLGKLMEEGEKNKLCSRFLEAITPYDLKVRNDSKVEDDGDKDPVMRKIRTCKNMGLLGTAIVSLSPLAAVVNSVAGRSLPLVGYVEENAMRAGIVIASTATVCMVLVLVVSRVAILFSSLLPTNEKLE